MLTGHQRRFLRGLAHHRKPVVTIGSSGVTSEVLEEIDQALSHHELLKVKLPPVDSSRRKTIIDQVCAATRAQWVQTIGRMGIIYRPASDPKIIIPDA